MGWKIVRDIVGGRVTGVAIRVKADLSKAIGGAGHHEPTLSAGQIINRDTGALLGGVIPFTLFVILPTNKLFLSR